MNTMNTSIHRVTIPIDDETRVVVAGRECCRQAGQAEPQGERIAQLVIVPILTPAVQIVDSLDDTARGTSGFGSTGHA